MIEQPRLFPIRTFPAQVVRVIDGDTVIVDIDFGMGLHQNWICRIDGVSCWKAGTEPGDAATDFARSVLSVGLKVTCVSLKWDKYGGRIDARIYLGDGRDFSEFMIFSGYAARWNGRGTAPLPPWPIPPRMT